MATEVYLRSPTTGLTKKGFYGFSWTVFFFACIPMLLRGDLVAFFSMLGLHILVASFAPIAGNALLNLILAFVYNRYYTRRLIEKGYALVSRDSAAEKALGITQAA